ncbi:DUF2252 domain-containing protein [Undibacterium sp. TJN19]|uniref:DUF2252 domain-containing protein n=1 Tax=Undibacterium sp. TJN19 TaxID=3413055 RepID=UPI003BF2F5BB
MLDVIKNIRNFNASRDPQRLAMKYRNMRQDPFTFLRGTCHLFYARLPKNLLLEKAPLAWCCGDLHLENFGCYKGDNRLVYFDINDFDEAGLAPLSWDLIRLASSILVAAPNLGIAQADAHLLCLSFLKTYRNVLANGKAYWVERDNATGLIRQLLDSVRTRQHSDFVNSRTYLKGDKRKIIIDGKKTLAVPVKQRDNIAVWINNFAEKQDNRKFFKVLDVAIRIAGTGSLGVNRYLLLVRGKGGSEGNYLLDLKQALPSAMASYTGIDQGKWKSEAERIVTLQKRMQAVSVASLQTMSIGKKSYVLRSLLPTDDRLSVTKANLVEKDFEKSIQTMAMLLASAHLRSSGRGGAANADELMAFANKKTWVAKIMALSTQCASQVVNDWQIYCQHYDEDKFVS